MCFTIDNDYEYILKCFDSLVFNEPSSKAIKYNDTILTYGQLDVLVNRIANLLKVKLKTQSLDSNSKSDLINDKLIIPIFIDKSHFTVASILAIWKLGYSFTVIDIRTPKARFNMLIKELNTDLIIDGDFISELNGLDEDFENPIDDDNYISIDDLALVCFTSGTTGTPKGVMINYKQICMASKNISTELIEKYLRSKCVMTLIPSFSMIAAHLITFGVMFSKGYLHIIPDEKILDLHYLIEYMKMNKINGSMFPPQLAEKFLRYADGLLEAFIVSTDKASNIYSSKTTIINLYGQTETLGFNTFFIIDKLYNDTPIGKPVNNIKVYLLDENLEEVSDGVVGEICVAGQLALGYLNDKKLTDEKFIPNPYSSSDEYKVLYKTGDLAYYNDNRDLVFLQRKDFMINIHGYRVEPTEIENTINKISGVEECVVAGFDVSDVTGIENDVRLYAGVVTDDNEEVFDVDKIKSELSELLPVYMIPSVIMKIDSIPLNQRGKIDRTHILPENILDIYLNMNSNDIVGPSTKLEKEIFDACVDILGYDNFGVKDNLINIGFSSISIIELTNKLFKNHKVELSLNDLMFMDIRMLAEKIEKSTETYKKYETRDYYPLSPQQLTYYQLIKDENFSSSKFDSHFSLTLIDIDPVKLKSAMIKAIEVNPDMKMFFTEIDGEIYQKRCDDLEINMPIIKGLVNVHEINDVVSFNLFKAPLFDFKIYYEGNITLILSSFNHTISDGVSIENFFRDVIELYSGKEVSKEVTYFDYVLDLLDSEKNNNVKVEQYLIDKTKDSSLESYFNLTHKKSDSETKYFHFDLNTPQNDIDLFCREFNVSHNTLILSSVVLALKDLFKKEEIYLEYIFNGRDKNIYYDICGLFRRHFPLFFNLNPKNSVKEYLKNVSEDIGDAVNILPSKKLEEIMYSFSKNSSFKIIYNYHDISEIVNNRQNQFNQNLIAYESPNLNNVNVSENELLINVNRHDKFKLSFSYDVAYFSEMDIENLCNSIDSYLLLLVNNPLKNLEDLII
ncbi:MAG: AMP-binding protein [Methanobrevibacter sp.]|jgi:acyl-CoA synthetase (AMP-forming)/AMP-acid ligase II/aryl carrier-like protein|nr:AMP-binding protein [Candidatus Methanovirga australis]